MPNVESLAAIWRPTQSTQISNSSVSHHQLETAYKAMLHLSVAFKFIAEDWIEFGHSCVSQQADMLLHAELNKYVLISVLRSLIGLFKLQFLHNYKSMYSLIV